MLLRLYDLLHLHFLAVLLFQLASRTNCIVNVDASPFQCRLLVVAIGGIQIGRVQLNDVLVIRDNSTH